MARRGTPPSFAGNYNFHLEHFFLPRLESFEKYIAFALKKFKSEKGKIDRARRKTQKSIKSKQIPEEYADDVFGNHWEDYDLVNSFDRTLIDSLAIQLFSILEVELNNLCNEWAEFHQEAYRVKDLKGEHIIDRVKIYFKQSLKVRKVIESKEWEFIQGYRLVRNALVHGDGAISKNEYTKLQKSTLYRKRKVKLTKHSEDEYYVSIPKADFLIEASNNVYNLLQNVANEVDEMTTE